MCVVGNDGNVSSHEVTWPLCAISPDISSSEVIIHISILWRGSVCQLHERGSWTGNIVSPVSVVANIDRVVVKEFFSVK